MPDNPNRLTAKQVECLTLVAEGLTSKEIARQLGISARTVDDHVEKARIKLDAPTRQRAAAIYRVQVLVNEPAPPPEWAPQRLRCEPAQVDQAPIDTPNEVVAPMLRDSGFLAFEHFPAAAPASVPPQPKDVNQQESSPLSTIALVLAIAAALALIALSYPQLVEGAEKMSAFIRSHSLSRGAGASR